MSHYIKDMTDVILFFLDAYICIDHKYTFTLLAELNQ